MTRSERPEANIFADAKIPATLCKTTPHWRSDLERHILRRTGRRVRDLVVDVVSEAVVLRGTAATYYVKQLAQHGVRELLPRVRLQNAIVVEPSACIP